jgi:major membrane immunogen (membrane-anchored lipoprotein)
MKLMIPTVAALLLLLASGCGLDDRPKPTAAEEEVRHPSNEMNPLPKEEPKHEHPKVAAAKQPQPKPHREPAYEDPRKIPAGIEFKEMVRRFGPPTMVIKDGPERTTYSYSKLKTQVQVEVQDGKVVSVGSIETGL